MMNKWLISGVVAALCYGIGFQTASKRAENERMKLVAEYQAKALSAQMQYSQQLEQALAQKQQWLNLMQKQSEQIALLNLDLDKAKSQLKEQAENAIKQDGRDFTGIGDNSLQIYNRAFGYSR